MRFRIALPILGCLHPLKRLGPDTGIRKGARSERLAVTSVSSETAPPSVALRATER